jgi:hypothetical protein
MHKNNEICRNERTICARKNKRLKKNKLLFCYNLQIKHKKEETEYEKESKEVV